MQRERHNICVQTMNAIFERRWPYRLSAADFTEGFENKLRACVEQLPLGKLTERNRQIALLRLTDEARPTLKQIGQRFGITGTCVRGIECKAFRMLRGPEWQLILQSCIVTRPEITRNDWQFARAEARHCIIEAEQNDDWGRTDDDLAQLIVTAAHDAQKKLLQCLVPCRVANYDGEVLLRIPRDSWQELRMCLIGEWQ